MIISKNDLKAYLIERAKEYATTGEGFPVYPQLQTGDRVSKNFHQGSLYYFIDDETIDQKVCDSDNDEDFFLELTNEFGPYDTFAVMDVKYRQQDRTLSVPFSRVVELRMAECLELAILIQLRMQRKTEAMVMGVLRSHPKLPTAPHAVNIVYYGENNPVLIDAATPLWWTSGQFYVPYIAEVEALADEQIIVNPQKARKHSYRFQAKL